MTKKEEFEKKLREYGEVTHNLSLYDNCNPDGIQNNVAVLIDEDNINELWSWIDSELKQARADELRQLNVDDPYINNRIKELEK